MSVYQDHLFSLVEEQLQALFDVCFGRNSSSRSMCGNHQHENSMNVNIPFPQNQKQEVVIVESFPNPVY